MKKNHPLTQQESSEEEVLMTSLRASAWDEFLGQSDIKKALLISLQATKSRKEPLDHTLFYGPPGLGKTTLAHLIAKELETNIKVTSGTAISKTADLAAILSNLDKGDVLFIDEIHRLPKAVEETLYPAMEDFALDIVIGKGPSARTLRIDLPPFTLVGATTRFGLLAGPFRDRFGIVHRFTHYETDALATIISAASKKLEIELTSESLSAIAARSRGTPRIALKLLKRVRDFAQIEKISPILKKTTEEALSLYQIDQFGLDGHDRQLLKHILINFEGGPVGLSTLAAALNEDSGTIEEVIEPYLLQIGFLKRTPQGRVATTAAKNHLKNIYSKEFE